MDKTHKCQQSNKGFLFFCVCVCVCVCVNVLSPLKIQSNKYSEITISIPLKCQQQQFPKKKGF